MKPQYYQPHKFANVSAPTKGSPCILFFKEGAEAIGRLGTIGTDHSMGHLKEDHLAGAYMSIAQLLVIGFLDPT